MPLSVRELAWFEAGEAVFHGCTKPESFPPPDDPHARRCWAGGFAAAWAEARSTADDPLDLLRSEDLSVALMLALRDHETLAAQLLAEHGHDAGTRPRH